MSVSVCDRVLLSKEMLLKCKRDGGTSLPGVFCQKWACHIWFARYKIRWHHFLEYVLPLPHHFLSFPHVICKLTQKLLARFTVLRRCTKRTDSCVELLYNNYTTSRTTTATACSRIWLSEHCSCRSETEELCLTIRRWFAQTQHNTAHDIMRRISRAIYMYRDRSMLLKVSR